MSHSLTTSLSSQTARTVLKLMHLSRLTDEKMMKLSKQNKGGTFQLGCAGHELIGVVAGQALTSGKDWSCPYYRDQPFALSIGSDLTELFGVFMGRAVKNHSAGRMMPHHYSHKDLRILCQSSVVGSQFLHAVGKALAIKYDGSDDVVYVSAGDGATSQGDFHEALNFAAIHKLPVIFVIQNNGWAISVPVEEQTAGGSLIDMCRGYAGLEVHEVDGTNYVETQVAMEKAVERGRDGEGPSLVMAHVPRLASHSNSDDPKKYKSADHFEEDVERDPLNRFERFLQAENILSEEEVAAVREEAHADVEAAALAADQLPFPAAETAAENVFLPHTQEETGSLVAEGEKIVIMDGINHALNEEMERDESVVVFGQDVAHGKGGVFGITRGLTDKHGKERCFNTPLAESTIVGVAIGMALDGEHKPVAEVQFADYVWTGINQLFNEASSICYRSNGEFSVPIVVRMPYGGYIQGGPYHSQSIEGFLTHCPGLKVVIPSNAADAKALLKTAIRDPNPVMFLEHKGLYRQQKFCARPEPSPDTLLPFGKANVVREGEDVTLIAWGMMVVMADAIAEKLAKEGISVEVIDLRTLVPLDMDTVLTSVKKTGKALIVHEAPRNCGFGSELAARISEEAFESLDGPVKRLCGLDAPVPYSKPLENAVLPQPSDIETTLRDLANY